VAPVSLDPRLDSGESVCAILLGYGVRASHDYIAAIYHPRPVVLDGVLHVRVGCHGRRFGVCYHEETLVQWIFAVREKAGEADRAVVADVQIGQLLAHSPKDPEDDAWPDQVVRNVIEKLEADHIDEGLVIERINMRGVYMKDPYEGGTKERALANQYRSWAEISRARWPRMARVLEAIAQSWESHALREDTQAEQKKLG
jgi:hypothetical protein